MCVAEIHDDLVEADALPAAQPCELPFGRPPIAWILVPPPIIWIEHRRLDLLGIASDRRAALAERREETRSFRRRGDDVPGVGITRDKTESPIGSAPGDEDRRMRT